MTPVDAIAAHGDIDVQLALHRDQLWSLGIRTALRRAEATRLCRRARWQARQARRLLQLRILRDVVVKAPRSRRKSARRRSRAGFVVIR